MALFLPFLLFKKTIGHYFLDRKNNISPEFSVHSHLHGLVLVFKYLRKECSDLNEIPSDNDGDKDDDDDDDDDDDANSKDTEVVEIGTSEGLMLDRLVILKYLPKEERNSLVGMKDKLEKMRRLNKKQNHISDYFILE